ncbi:MAG: hypothetical protein R2753_06585 [Chitinophagales bacterium]
MRNVIISQSNATFTGVTQSSIDTSNINFGYYQVPLDFRNEKYPDDFKSLPSEQLFFPLIDDEVPLNLGDKIDYKDYINFTDSNGDNHFAIVNPIKRSVLQNDDKYRKISSIENGEILPPPSVRNANIPVVIPKISTSAALLSNQLSSTININDNILIPVIIPIVLINSTYQFINTNIPPNSNVQFNLIQYKGIFKKEVKLAAVNIKLASTYD